MKCSQCNKDLGIDPELQQALRELDAFFGNPRRLCYKCNAKKQMKPIPLEK